MLYMAGKTSWEQEAVATVVHDLREFSCSIIRQGLRDRTRVCCVKNSRDACELCMR